MPSATQTKPPLLEKLQRIKKICFLAVFVGTLGLAFPIFNVFSRYLSMDNHENRLLTTLPTVLSSPLRELPDNLNNFLVDNSPFRYQLVLANATLNWHAFGTVESEQVLLGKENWLFYKDGPNKATPLANYQGTIRLSETQLSALAQKLQQLSDAYAERGGRLVVNFAPSKDIIYREYVPEDYPILSETDVTSQLADYLREHTTVNVSYVPNGLLQRKGDPPLYFKYDTHWNHMGALIALDDILSKLDVPTARFVDYDFQVDGRQTGDMTNVAALYRILPDEEDYFPMNYSFDLDKRTMILYGDSFSEYYMPYLEKRFTNVWRDALTNLNPQTLPDCGADFVVIEANERSFASLCSVLGIAAE